MNVKSGPAVQEGIHNPPQENNPALLTSLSTFEELSDTQAQSNQLSFTAPLPVNQTLTNPSNDPRIFVKVFLRNCVILRIDHQVENKWVRFVDINFYPDKAHWRLPRPPNAPDDEVVIKHARKAKRNVVKVSMENGKLFLTTENNSFFESLFLCVHGTPY